MDGIKPTLSDLNDDQTPVYDAVKVDLLHPSGPANIDPSVPEPSARVAPITPPFHAAPESNVEMVRNTPPPPLPEPTPAAAAPVPDKVQAPAAAPIFDRAPASSSSDNSVAAPVGTSGAPFMAPASKSSKGKGVLIVIIILLLIVGAGAAYYFLVFSKKKPVVTAPASISLTAVDPTKLTQRGASSTLAAGATTSIAPTLGATLATKATTGSAILQAEVEPVGTDFSSAATVSGQPVSANGGDLSLSVTLKTLPVGSYHWRARTQVGSDDSAWVNNNSATPPTADFIMAAAVAPTAPTVTAIGGGAVSGTTITTTQNQPALSGTTASGSTLSITVTPDNITLTPTVAANGTWTVTPSQQLANGAHTLALSATDSTGNNSQASYALTINPVATVPATPTVSSTPPSTTPSSGGTAAPTTTPAATPAAGNLAATGDPTQPLTLIALVIGLSAALGLVYLCRYDHRHQDDQG